MNKLTCTFFFCWLAVASFGQGKVTGLLKAPDGKPAEFASAAIFNASDSTLVRGTLADSTGRFVLEQVPNGNYYVQCGFIGFEVLVTPGFSLDSRQHTKDLGTLFLKPDIKTLEAVTITARKPLVEQRLDRTVLNVENSILAEGNTALELLEKSPGVTVDDEGDVSLKGKTGVSIMINGKLTYLSQRELATLLRGTTSSAVSRIELITNPSARYDAAGNSGIINIVLKKNEQHGVNGSVYANAARSRANRYGGGLNLNYRTGKWNVYGSYDHAFRGEIEYLRYERRFYDGETGQAPRRISYQETATSEPLYTHNYKLGADLFADASNTIGVLVKGNFGTYINDNNTSNLLVATDGTVLSRPQTHNDNKDRWNSLAYNLNYVHKFRKEGREISMDLDYSKNDNRSNQKMDTKYQHPASPEWRSVRKGFVPSKTDVYVGKADYAHPLSEKAKLETGWKSSFVSVDNNLKYDTLRNGAWQYDASWSNHFTYKEIIHAGYVNYCKEFGALTIQVGLRGEHTSTEGHQVTTDSLVKRSYFQLFPSAFITQKIGKEHTLQLSYSRRVERPDYGDLNPFRFFRDPFLYYEGNPFLKPERTHSAELSHAYGGKLITTLNYSYTSDVVNWIMGQVDSINTTFQGPQNLRSQLNYGLSFALSLQPASWWSTSNFLNIYHNRYKGDHKGGALDNRATALHFNSQNSLQLGNGYSAELSGFYHSKDVYGVFVTKPYYLISLGAQKQVLKNKGSVKLMINDLFQSRQRRQTGRYENLDMNGHIRFDSRTATLSFTYRFGQEIKPSRTRSSGSEDIQNRVQGGG